MSAGNLFGPIVDGDLVEQALSASLRRWVPTQLGEMERLKGYNPGDIEPPRGYVSSSEFENWTGDQLPVLVSITSKAAQAVRREDGAYEAMWPTSVACIVSDVDQPSTRKLGMAMAAAVRSAVVQHKLLKSDEFPDGLGGSSVMWTGEDYAQIRFDETRTLFAPLVQFEITVQNVVVESAGPREPIEDPTTDPGSLPALERIETRVDLRPLQGAVSE